MKISRYIQLVFLLCFVLLLFAYLPVQAKTIHLTAGNWAPYLGPNLPFRGMAGKIIKKAFAVQGIEVEIEFFPWKRAYKLAQKGEYDGTAIWLKKADRQKDFYYSDVVVVEKHVFFHLKEKRFAWSSISDLQGQTLGGLQGFSYGAELDRVLKEGKIKMERVNSDVTNFKKLLAKRIDLYPQELNVGLYVLKNYFDSEQIRQVTYDEPFMKKNSYLLLTKDKKENKELIRVFNQGLEYLKTTGAYSEILESY
jgi:polar amino acid transport system substrate-binding protein